LTDLQWLPDQSGLIATAEQGSGPKWVARLDFSTGALTAITPPVDVQRISSLDLSPDGRVIAYALDGNDIRFITLDGAPAPGYPTGLQGTFPAFSPDGRLLAYSRNHDGTSTIDGIWFHRFSDGETWRALPAGHVVTWVKDWE
jgi:Tol biopolymer transport system component